MTGPMSGSEGMLTLLLGALSPAPFTAFMKARNGPHYFDHDTRFVQMMNVVQLCCLSHIGIKCDSVVLLHPQNHAISCPRYVDKIGCSDVVN